MHALLQWLTAPEWAQVVKALLHSLWQGALIAAVLAIVLRVTTRPALRYRLALSCLGLLVLSTILTWAVLNSSQSTSSPVVPAIAQAIEPTPVSVEPAETIAVTTQWTHTQPTIQWTSWLALIWLIGASAMLGRASVKVAGAEQLRRGCKSLNNPSIARLLAEARKAVNLTRQVRIAVTEKLTSPAVVGVLVPTLILPLSLITTLSSEQIRLVLLHEIAHIQRGDYLANLFQLLAEALFFFHPAVWWLSHQIRQEREACCDALAIELSGAPVDYAQTLVHVAENALNPAPAAAPAFGKKDPSSTLRDRVQRVLVPGHRPTMQLTWRSVLAALVMGGLVLGLLAIGARQTVAAALGNKASDSLPLDPESVDIPYVSIEKWPDFLRVKDDKLQELIPEVMDSNHPWAVDKSGMDGLQDLLSQAGAMSFDSSEPLYGAFVSGMRCQWRVGYVTNFLVNYLVTNVVCNGSTNERLATIDVDYRANTRGWVPMEFSMIPRVRSGAIQCELLLKAGGTATRSRATLPIDGGLVWVTPKRATADDSRQLVVLRDKQTSEDRASEGVNGGSGSGTIAPSTADIGITEKDRMVQDGKLLYELGKLDEAIEKFNEALLTDPEDDAAKFYLDLARPASGEKLISREFIAKGPGLASALQAEPTGTESSQANAKLNTRTYKLDPTEFARAVGLVGPVQPTNAVLQVRRFFADHSLNFEPPKAFFYKDAPGLLWARATLEELDTIEELIQVMNSKPLQVNIRARFVEMPEGGFEDFLRNALNLTNRVAGFTGILTDPQYRVVLKALDQREGVGILSAPEVTTVSGRQAQIQMVDIQSVVTGVVPIVTNGISTNVFQVTPMPFGPVLDVVPVVSDDGHTIQMTLVPSVTEFLGYDDPGEFRAGNRWGVSVPVDPLPLPKFRQRRLTTSVNVWDGQTVVLGGFVSEEVTRNPDGSEQKASNPKLDKKQLLVFVTPTIIDQAGNRISGAPSPSHGMIPIPAQDKAPPSE